MALDIYYHDDYYPDDDGTNLEECDKCARSIACYSLQVLYGVLYEKALRGDLGCDLRKYFPYDSGTMATFACFPAIISHLISSCGPTSIKHKGSVRQTCYIPYLHNPTGERDFGLPHKHYPPASPSIVAATTTTPTTTTTTITPTAAEGNGGGGSTVASDAPDSSTIHADEAVGGGEWYFDQGSYSMGMSVLARKREEIIMSDVDHRLASSPWRLIHREPDGRVGRRGCFSLYSCWQQEQLDPLSSVGMLFFPRSLVQVPTLTTLFPYIQFKDRIPTSPADFPPEVVKEYNTMGSRHVYSIEVHPDDDDGGGGDGGCGGDGGSGNEGATTLTREGNGRNENKRSDHDDFSARPIKRLRLTIEEGKVVRCRCRWSNYFGIAGVYNQYSDGIVISPLLRLAN